MQSDATSFAIPGHRWRQSHRATVISILGDKAPPVSSRGSQFYSVDRWTLRFFVTSMCKWAKENPGAIPTEQDIAGWVREANTREYPPREIVIANTPDNLTLRVALALMGGAYHEAFHPYYSCTRDLIVREMTAMVLPRWAKVPDWSKYHNLLQILNNLVEDIRIERNGRREFPGCEEKMHDLQDLILDMESETESGIAVRGHGEKKPASKMSLILSVFRDVGLGYHTPTQRMALDRYKAEDPKAVKYVLGEGRDRPGPLSDALREAIALSNKDDLGCVRLAMDIIDILFNTSDLLDPANSEEEGEGEGHEPGSAHAATCPACGAPGNKLVVRPKSDGAGGHVKGVGILTCSSCGHQEEVKLKGASAKKGQKFEGSGPRLEGFNPGDIPGMAGAGEDEGEGEGEGDGQGAGKKGQGAGEGKSKGKGKGKGYRTPGETPEDEGFDTGESETISNEESSSPGGGHCYDAGSAPVTEWADLIQEALEHVDDVEVLDGSAALESAVGAQIESEVAAEGGVQKGEALWSPVDPEKDEVKVVTPSSAGRDNDQRRADQVYGSIQVESSYMRARLRQIMRALEMTTITHGVPRGRNLSSRFLVDSCLSIRAGQVPKRAYTQRDDQIDTSMAICIVLDESSSMHGMLTQVTQMLCALTEPVDSLGQPVMALGFRDGSNRTEGEGHRQESVIYDIFKHFDEPLHSVRWRFANTRAVGGTPMSDGIQFGLRALSERKEGHRILFVLTDGQPNSGHMPIMRRQFRVARESGIHVVGVGVTSGAQYVQNVFPDSVWRNKVSEMPAALIAKLNQIVDATKRGMRYEG